MKREINMKEVRRAAFEPNIRSIDEKARTIEFVASTEDADRHGDKIMVAGWDLTNYKKNPVFLFAHKSRELPIGRTVKIEVQLVPKPALVQTVKFTDPEENPLGDQVFRLYRGGFMNAVSVGFRLTKRPKMIENESGDFVGWEINGQELLELSAVPVPANPEALARGIESGELTKEFVEEFFGKDGAQGEDSNDKERGGMKTKLQEVLGKAVETTQEFEEKMAVYVKREELADFQAGLSEALKKAVGSIVEAANSAIEAIGQKVNDVSGEVQKLTRRVDDSTVAVANVHETVNRIDLGFRGLPQKKDITDLDARATSQRELIEKGFKASAKTSDVETLVVSDKEFSSRFDALRKGVASEADIQSISVIASDSAKAIAKQQEAISDLRAEMAEVKKLVGAMLEAVGKVAKVEVPPAKAADPAKAAEEPQSEPKKVDVSSLFLAKN